MSGEDTRGPGSDAIAIIGMAGRWPGAGNIEEFWGNLCAGVESITRFSGAELEDSFSDEIRNAPNFVKARPVLDGVDQFDADFFGMYAKEAELTDPQHRLFLECCWEALENGGYDPAAFRGAIGVIAGCSINTYFLHHVLGDRRTSEEFTSSYQVGCYPMLLGAGLDFLSTRVSYKLDLRGPSLTLETACSTSLLAVAQACQSLLLYQADMALAGGVSITFPQRRGYQHLEGGMVSADGHCRPFDADASGTIFGSGAGCVLLKRLDDALADRDHIYAVIRGSGVNNDGAGKAGFTAPSSDGQAAVIEMAMAAAGVEARSISYVECHGTATPLGDPIEVAGLTRAFAAGSTDKQFCALGSVKSNIGHLDAAAGVTGLIKTALSLQHGMLPPTLHYRKSNPQIDFPSTPFYVNTQLRPWPTGDAPRRAGVSAFGVGGTNVHVILEEAPALAAAASDGDGAAPQLLVLSARSTAALDQARKNLATHLAKHPMIALEDVAHSLRAGRRSFEHRLSLVAADRNDAIAKLEGRESNTVHVARAPGKSPQVVFMFPGQGSQYPAMGRDLYERAPEFRMHLDRCAAILRPLDVDLIELLYPRQPGADDALRLMATSAAQPAIFAVEYSLAKLWMSWGVQPQAMIGHSVGEFVAAALAGIYSLEDGLAIVAARGRLMQELPGGAMLAVRLPEAEIAGLLSPELAIAAINAPSLCVISGPHAAVAALEKILAERGVVTRRLHTAHAFHSSLVDPILAPMRAQLQSIRLAAPALPCVSCVTGTWLRPEQATSPDYWARHAREPVRFADAVRTAGGSDAPLLIEMGAGNALATLASQTLRGRDVPVLAAMQDSARERSDVEVALDALGRSWACGVKPDWTALGGRRRRVPLPTYPFQRSRHWVDAPRGVRDGPEKAALPALAAPAALPAIQGISIQDDPVINQADADGHVAAVTSRIAAIFEELSGEKPPSGDAAATFLEMGYDSLFLTQVAQKIQSQMRVKITFRQLLGEYSTVAKLAVFLAEKMPAQAPAASAANTGASAAVAAVGAVAPGGAAAAGMEGLFRQQLLAMTDLINRQFALLQGQAAVVPAAPASAAAAAVDAAATDQVPSRFQIYKPVERSADSGILPAQQRHIEQLVARYTMKTAGSKRMTQAHRGRLADPRAAAGFRAEWKEMVYPIVVAKAAGSKLQDVDGNEYIDLVNGYGQTAFGHSPKFVVDAVKAQLDLGFAIGPQAELAGKVAALFSEMTGNERVTFCNTGSEAVMAAMRVARTVTGREKVVIFNGDYHGQFDEVLVKGVQRVGAAPRSMPVAPGIPGSAVSNMVVLDYATPQTLQWIRENAADLAAVIVEPVQSRHPDLQPFEFLRELRKITELSGTAFVMDEVVTGFRVHPGGIQAVAGIQADMATYGKVVGGGLPVGILAGKAKFMDALDGGEWQYGDDSFPEVGVTFFAGTFVRHPLVLAATWAVLNHLKDRGPELQQDLARRTASLVTRLRELFANHGLATKIESYSSWFYFHFHGEHPLATLFFYHLRERGIHIQDGFPCFLTTAHSDADLERIFTAFRDGLEALQSVGILGATTPRDGGVVGPVPLTESQMEIWLSAQMGDEASCAFNESVSLRLSGALNEAALRAALNQVIARHDALRASFSATGEEMRIAPPADLDPVRADFSGMPPAAAELSLARLLDTDARTAFDLVAGPCVRAALVKLSADSHVLVLTAHHIVCDGWSINVVVGELAQIYAALCRRQQPELPAPLPFSEFARAQSDRDPADLARTEAFWLGEFRRLPASLELPTDRARSAQRTFSGASRCRRIDAGLYQAVKKAGAREGSTLFVTLLAAFQALMGRLSNQDEVVVGVPTAGQSLLEDQILVGHCVNFLPIKASWNGSTTVAEHLAATGKRVLDAYEHQNYTFGTLVRKLALTREAGRLPLAELQFNLERLADNLDLPGLKVEVVPNAKAHVNFDLFLNVIESTAGLRLDCDYNTDLFDAATIDHWLDCYQALLESIVADAAIPLCRSSCLPTAERVRLLVDMNDTAIRFGGADTIHALIESRARAVPQSPAVRFGDDALSYAELDGRANRLANLLLAKIGAAPTGRLVGVAVDRSIDMLVALLAVLKAGCAYVPLDPMHPAARLRYILGEAAVAALISDGSENASLVGAGTPLIDVVRDAALIATAPAAAPAVTVTASDLAYVMYTSGSTGAPKGVEVSHAAVANLLQSMAREPGFTSRDVLLAVTTISFDIAGLELFLPLTTGGTVVIAERDAVIDGFKLLQQLTAVGATAMQATPASWRLLLEAGFKARPGFKMLCGGEALPRELADRLLAGSGELWNMYGPTETTIWSSCARVTAGGGPITVGGPIANTQFYILDHHDQPVPAGIPGQLHIGGSGVARGYHKRAELTAEKFVNDALTGGRMYRTGDLAKWLPDGGLQILGRIDHQIKLRGFRIELGEIETVLVQNAGLGAAAVLLREDTPGSARLVAYYVESDGKKRRVEDLRTLLADQMPEYMVPSAWVKLTALPLSPNGKLDRAALPAPDGSQTVKEEYVAPTTATEQALTKIFQEVLQLPRIGRTADLLKLGADSIQLFQITARANRSGYKITAKQLLQVRNAAALGALIDAAAQAPGATDAPLLPTLGQFQRGRRAGANTGR